MGEGKTEQTVKLPELGEGVKEGEFLKWYVAVGDSVKVDQVLSEVMTDKASLEVPSPFDGVVKELKAKAGEVVEVGQTLLVMDVSQNGKTKSPKPEEGTVSQQSIPESGTPLPRREDQKIKAEEAKQSAFHSTPPVSGGEDLEDGVQAVPYTRRLAKQLGVNLKQIKGSGLFGRITKEDVLKYAGVSDEHTGAFDGHKGMPKPVHQGEWIKTNGHETVGFRVPKLSGQERIPLKGIRKIISERLTLSKRVIPHFSLMDSAHVDKLVKMRSSVKEMLKEEKVKVTYLAFILKALLKTVKKFPELNASVDDFSQEQVIKRYYHFGVAADTPKGLMVPVVKDVDKKNIKQLCLEIQTLAEKARAGKILPDEMQNATLTITNIGSVGGRYGTPVINPPEALILGVYRLHVTPGWTGEKFVPVQTMNFSFTADHRIIDGALAARALAFFIKTIEEPLSLFF